MSIRLLDDDHPFGKTLNEIKLSGHNGLILWTFIQH